MTDKSDIKSDVDGKFVSSWNFRDNLQSGIYRTDLNFSKGKYHEERNEKYYSGEDDTLNGIKFCGFVQSGPKKYLDVGRTGKVEFCNKGCAVTGISLRFYDKNFRVAILLSNGNEIVKDVVSEVAYRVMSNVTVKSFKITATTEILDFYSIEYLGQKVQAPVSSAVTVRKYDSKSDDDFKEKICISGNVSETGGTNFSELTKEMSGLKKEMSALAKEIMLLRESMKK